MKVFRTFDNIRAASGLGNMPGDHCVEVVRENVIEGFHIAAHTLGRVAVADGQLNRVSSHPVAELGPVRPATASTMRGYIAVLICAAPSSRDSALSSLCWLRYLSSISKRHVSRLVEVSVRGFNPTRPLFRSSKLTICSSSGSR